MVEENSYRRCPSGGQVGWEVQKVVEVILEKRSSCEVGRCCLLSVHVLLLIVGLFEIDLVLLDVFEFQINLKEDLVWCFLFLLCF